MATWILLVAATVGAEPSLNEYQHRISDLIKREAQTKDPAARAAAVRGMCELHGEIVHDSRYGNSDALKEYRGRLWSRLSRVKTELRQQLRRDKSNKELLDSLDNLASASSVEVAAAESLASSLSLLGQSQHGPGALLSFGGAAGPADWGPDLVDLIERTINPAFWDVAGGPGTIVYYRPLHCLVVRATSEVHGNLGQVIGDLRAVK